MATIVTAPDGYKSLKKGVCYYLLKTHVRKDRVLLVSFHEHQKANQAERVRSAVTHVLSRESFEAGLSDGAPGKAPSLVVATKDNAMPHWLADIEGRDLDAEPQMFEVSKNSQLSLHDEVVERLVRIQPALEAVEDVLSADFPDQELNKFARACRPAKVNETRFRLWFYLYLVFDRRIWVLLGPRFRCGRWDRLDPQYQASQLGRPSDAHGVKVGHKTTPEMIQKIVNGFRRYAKSAGSLASAIPVILRKEFGCSTRKLPDGSREIYHPRGEPFPSTDKFYYYLKKIVGPDEVRRVLLGEVRMRNEYQPHMGRMSDFVYFTGERAHMDAATVLEYPRGYLGEYHLERLKRVDLVDSATGQIQGVGFSLGSEDDDIYKLALFCAAVPKSKFGRLFGIEIDDSDWPSVGLPANVVTDRGPGGSASVKKELNKWVIAREATPSYQPKSNAPTESKHTRNHNKGAPPEYKFSDHTPIELIKREILDVIRKNRSDDVSSRLTDQAVLEDVGCPNDLYEFLVRRERSSLIDVPFEDAVRSFLKETEFHAERGELTRDGRRYLVPASHLPTLGAAIVRFNKKTPLKGYYIPLAPLYAWVEFNGELIEVQAFGHPTDDALFMTDGESHLVQQARGKASTRQKRRVVTERVAAQERCKTESGKEWFSGRSSGRLAASTPDQRDEIARLKHSF